jgi:hypothetical protein
MNFGHRETDEIPELLQLDLPQSEFYIPGYKIMKVTRSAEFTDSNNSTNSYVSPWIQNEYS